MKNDKMREISSYYSYDLLIIEKKSESNSELYSLLESKFVDLLMNVFTLRAEQAGELQHFGCIIII